MAKGKKSFVLYCDQKEIFELLPMQKRGELITIIFDYVNDKNPIVTDPELKMAFTFIKQSLKRDLVKYEKRAERSRNNGSLGGRPTKPKQPSGLNENPKEPRKPDNVTDTVTDSVNVTVNDNVSDNDILLEKETKSILIKKFTKKDFKKVLLDLGADEENIDDWIQVREKKKAAFTKTAIKSFIKECNKYNYPIAKAVQKCAENSWSGFKVKWLENLNNSTYGKQNNTQEPGYSDLKERIKKTLTGS